MVVAQRCPALVPARGIPPAVPKAAPEAAQSDFDSDSDRRDNARQESQFASQSSKMRSADSTFFCLTLEYGQCKLLMALAPQ